mmetsp:Transcript_29225/g.21751  ORF Transcript_29225/g.21751 Transcript_29225/m.21751 type:complete len:187 (+) Transcript_29225:94-654(+)
MLILGQFTILPNSVMIYTFCSLEYTQEYGEDEEGARAKLSLLFLISNALAFPASLLAGYFSDRFCLWKVYLLTLALSMAANLTFISQIDHIGPVQDSAFVAMLTLGVMCFLLNWSYVSKLVNEKSAGAIYGVVSLAGSTGILIMDELGGHLFDNKGHFWPMLLSLCSQTALFVLMATFGALKKLKI